MNPEQKKLIGAGLIALALAALLALVWPRFNATQEAREAVGAKSEVVSRKKKFLAKIADFKNQLTVRSDDLTRIDDLVTSGKQTQDLLVSLESIAQQAGAVINNLKTGTVASGTTKESFETLQIELVANGPYSALAEFIKLLEKNLRIFDVTEFSIVRKEGGTLLALNIKFNTYFLK